MKTIEQQYAEAFAEAQRCKPRSQRKTILMDRMIKLKAKLMRLEMRKEKRAA